MTEMQRLNCDVISDDHIHPGYSIDAEGSVDDYCRAAMAVGLKEICFTTHYDADPVRLGQEGYMVIDGKREKLSDDCVRMYMEDVRRAATEFGQTGLMVRAGMEFGYFAGCERPISELQSKFSFDYRLGSVHNIDGDCVCCRQESGQLFKRMTLTKLADRYFELLDRCAATGLFDCLGHLDVYRRYGLEYYGEEINTIHRGRIEKLFETMRKHNVGYEVNTSAIRHGLFEYYPGMEIINMARASGVTLLALGSDAHKPAQMALDFDTASGVAYELVPYVDE